MVGPNASLANNAIFAFFTLFAFAAAQTPIAAAVGDSYEETLNATVLVLTFSVPITTDNENQTFNAYVEVSDGSMLNSTTYVQVSVGSAVNASTDINFNTTTLNSPDTTDVVSCNTYPSSGNVYTQVSATGLTGNMSIAFTAQFGFYDSCSTDNFGGSDIWIWIVAAIVVILVIVVVVVAAIGGFVYWKKKQQGNYALYNDS